MFTIKQKFTSINLTAYPYTLNRKLNKEVQDMEKEDYLCLEEGIIGVITRELLQKAVSNGLIDEIIATKVNKKMVN